MKSRPMFVIILACLALLASACTPLAASTPTSTTLTLKDGLGRQVTLTSPARKIISLAPSNSEVLFAIGAGADMIGRDEFSDYPPDVKNLPSVGGSMGKYDLEEIARLQPDLVLAASLNTPEQIQSIESLGLKVFLIPNPNDFNGLYANILTVGQLTGHTGQAEQLVASLKQQVKVVEDNVAETTSRPKLFYELDATDPAKPWTAGPGSYIDTLIKIAGGVNVASGLQSDYAQISQEELIAANPDVILLGDGAYGVTPAQVTARPGWGDIAAVKNNRVLTFDDNLVSRPGPRLVDGLELIYKALHP
jgi:iron complex transport system substrate-binding protein